MSFSKFTGFPIRIKLCLFHSLEKAQIKKIKKEAIYYISTLVIILSSTALQQTIMNASKRQTLYNRKAFQMKPHETNTRSTLEKNKKKVPI